VARRGLRRARVRGGKQGKLASLSLNSKSVFGENAIVQERRRQVRWLVARRWLAKRSSSAAAAAASASCLGADGDRSRLDGWRLQWTSLELKSMQTTAKYLSNKPEASGDDWRAVDIWRWWWRRKWATTRGSE
jgi:hypothetical protein